MTKNKVKRISSTLIKQTLEQTDPIVSQQIRNRMEMATRIDEARELKGLSKKELADKLSKRPSEISKWLSGTHNFTMDTLSMLEIVLGANLLSVMKAMSVSHEAGAMAGQKPSRQKART
jgi:ribosome-binding protein aMBF1 (putative translation factor)